MELAKDERVEDRADIAETPVPMVDLRLQYARIREEMERAAAGVLGSARYILGPNVEAFESELAGYCGTKYCVGVASGTDALELALRAAGVGDKDEVITTPFTFAATVEAIYYLGARPVFCDIDPDTFNIDPGKINEGVTGKTKAILSVDLYGQVAEMDRISSVAASSSLRLIEDSAQAIGATYKGKAAGSLADLGTFSFYPSKNLGACGDAGAIVCDDDEMARKLRLMRDHGNAGSYIHEMLGQNSRLDELQAALLRVKLRYLDRWTERRRELAALYDEYLREAPVSTPPVAAHSGHNYYLYTIRAQRRDELKEFLRSRRIASVVYYPVPMHLQPAFSDLGYRAGDFPEAERASREVLSIPIAPELTEEQIARVARSISDFYSGSR
jgi:dTDP-4-amino-4,6-dideoxygalactose transaminase